jgi:hypothetical protein
MAFGVRGESGNGAVPAGSVVKDVENLGHYSFVHYGDAKIVVWVSCGPIGYVLVEDCGYFFTKDEKPVTKVTVAEREEYHLRGEFVIVGIGLEAVANKWSVLQ